MCKSVQSQNQPSKTGCFAQPQKLDFNSIYCAKSSSFIQTTILHDTNRVEARFADGSTVAIDCIAIEDE